MLDPISKIKHIAEWDELVTERKEGKRVELIFKRALNRVDLYKLAEWAKNERSRLTALGLYDETED